MYVIDEYNVPGPTAHSVRLVWRGLPPRLGAGVSLALLLALVGLALATFVAESAEGVHPAVVAVAAVGVGLIGWLAVRGDRKAYVSALTWEARRGVLLITRGGAFPGFGKDVEIPFDQVRSLQFDVGGEGKGLVWVRCRAERVDGPRLDEWMQIRGVDRQSKALDLAIRIGAAMGWKGYEVTRCTPQAIRVSLTREAVEGALAGGVPRLDDDPIYVAEPPGTAEREVPAFRSEAYDGPYDLARWEPGVSVLLRRRSAAFWRPREIEIDWGAGALVVRTLLGSKTLPLAKAEQVVLTGPSTLDGRATPTWAWYGCDLLIRIAGEEVHVEGPSRQGDPASPRAIMLPLAVDLARALGVPWGWEAEVEPPSGEQA